MKNKHNSLNFLIQTLTVSCLLLVGVAAQSKSSRVIVFMKDQNAYSQVHNSYRTYGSRNLQMLSQSWGSSSNHALSQVDGEIQNTLGNMKGVVVHVSNEKEIQKLRSNPAVELVDEEVFYPAPKPFRGLVSMGDFSNASNFKTTTKTPWGILAVKAIEAWSLSNKGSGARVLVLDTGIDKDHPSLKPNFEKGKSFVDANSQLPYEFFDDVGHGSHCSGTIAGAMDSNGFTGVAPQAKLLMGKVCSPEGCSNISVAQGLNWGITENVDVVSMSLGGPSSTPSERKAVANAYKAGITIVAAAGNDGTNKVSYPAALPQSIAVGALDSNLQKASFSQYGPELAIAAPGVDVVSSVPQGTGRESSVKFDGQAANSTFIEGTKSLPTSVTNEVVDAGTGRPEDYTNANAAGKFVLVRRGDIKIREKVQNAIAANVAAVILVNNVPGLVRGSLAENGVEMQVPVFMIEQTQGEALFSKIKAGQKVSGALQVISTDYSSFDGTSMATPHVAGVVALVKATNKKLSPAQVKSILQSTAKTLGPNSNNEFGSGLVQADAAVQKASQTVGELP